MSRSQNWEVMSWGQFTIVELVGGGIIHFRFRNKDNGHSKDFAMICAGVGVGVSVPGSAAGVRALNSAISVYSMSASQILNIFMQTRAPNAYSTLNCVRPFSFHDLHLSFAAYANLFIGLVVGLSASRLSIKERMFSSVEYVVPVTTIGVSADAVYNASALTGVLVSLDQCATYLRNRPPTPLEHRMLESWNSGVGGPGRRIE